MTLCPANTLLDDIAAEIGLNATHLLIDFFGGRSIYIPPIATSDHPIACLLGLKRFAILCREFGGGNLNVSEDYQRERNRRNALIRALLSHGMNSEETAHIVGLSDRQVDNVRAELVDAGLLQATPRSRQKAK
jgi:hypothetical protein